MGTSNCENRGTKSSQNWNDLDSFGDQFDRCGWSRISNECHPHSRPHPSPQPNPGSNGGSRVGTLSSSSSPSSSISTSLSLFPSISLTSLSGLLMGVDKNSISPSPSHQIHSNHAQINTRRMTFKWN